MNERAVILDGYDSPGEVGQLFREYTDALLAEEPGFAAYLAQQNYEEELAHLEEKYGRPGGRLYLLRCGEETAGTIALRKIDAERCEMKRLYVRPAFRGRGFAELLVRKILRDAAEEGYRQVLLDTFPFLSGAIRLYRKLGFQEVPSYNGSPMENLIYLSRELP